MPDTTIEPGPFDAIPTLKPNEPHFTLQGGDPLAPEIVLAWAKAARKAALDLSEGSLEQRSLLIKATSAEEVAWTMQSYQRNWMDERIEEIVTTPVIAAEYRRDVYDTRRDLGRYCSQAESELNAKVESLQTFEHDEADQLKYAVGFHAIATACMNLRQAALVFFPTRGPTQGT